MRMLLYYESTNTYNTTAILILNLLQQRPRRA